MSVLLFATVSLLAATEQWLAYEVGLISGQFYKVLGGQDLPAFKQLVATSLATVLGLGVVLSLRVFSTRSLTVEWRRNLTHSLHSLYFRDIGYYRLNVVDASLDNPDQRITADVDSFCTAYGSILVNLLLAPFTISYYTYQAYYRAGWPGPTAMFGLFAVSAVINKLLMSPVVSATVEQERREGDFRFKHVAVRVNSEPLAFHGSAAVEHLKTGSKLQKLCRVQQRVVNRQLCLDLSTNTFDYLGSITSYLVIAIPIFSGDYSGLEPPEVSKIIAENAFVCMYLFYQFSKLADMATTVTSMAGATHRIAELRERLSSYSEKGRGDSSEKNSSCEECEKVLVVNDDKVVESRGDFDDNSCPKLENGSILCSMQNLSIWAPSSDRKLLHQLSMDIKCGENLLIMGRSSAGKTSLMRVLRGLWKNQEGLVRILVPEEQVFFLPQRPFFTDGSLLDQALYPKKKLSAKDAEEFMPWLEATLEELGLTELVERCRGLDVDPLWSDWREKLSPGEAQRLAFVRLLARRPSPTVAFLDEATSALPADMEARLYEKLVRSGVTVVSVGHKQELKRYHDKVLWIGGDKEGEWTVLDSN